MPRARSSSRRRRSSRPRTSACARRRSPCRSRASSASATSFRARRSAPSSPSLTVVDLATLELAGRSARTRSRCWRRGRRPRSGSRATATTVPGRIDRIAPAAEAGTRAIGVVVVLDNQGERFRAGQYGQARVALADTTERMTVPIAAVGQASGQDYVWAIERQALVRRIVVTGRRDVASGRIEVDQGTGAGRADPGDALRQPQGRRAGQGRRPAQRGRPGVAVVLPPAASASSSPSASASATPVRRS